MAYYTAKLDAGSVWGRLTATEQFEMRVVGQYRGASGPKDKRRSYQLFLCECGAERWLVVYSVRSGNTSSCGCLHREVVSEKMTTHGLSKTSAYRVQLNKARRSAKRAARIRGDADRITAADFAAILEEYDNCCWICELELETVHWDHVRPLSKGGDHVVSNLRPACAWCNGRKGAQHPFTEDMKNQLAAEVRALRASQADRPDTDGTEV
jgi:5-methylcytosine-specific restriction endonuclease McrA